MTYRVVEVIQCEPEVFADDTKIYSIIETILKILLAKLQQDLNNVGLVWSKLSLNIDKCIK